MPKFLVVHTMSVPASIEEATPLGKKAKAFSTVDAYWVKTWIQLNDEGKAVKTICEWNAVDVEAIRKVWEKIPEFPPDGIYPMMVVDSEDFR